MEKESLRQLILSHFDQFQRRENSNIVENDDKSTNSPRGSNSVTSFTFDTVNKGNSRSDAELRAAMIRKDISYFKRVHKLDHAAHAVKRKKAEGKDDADLSEMMGNLDIDATSKKVQDEILGAVLHCINAAFVLASQNIKTAEGAIHNILDLAAALGYTLDTKEGYSCHSIIDHIGKFIVSEEDVIRTKACNFFGYQLAYLFSWRSSALSFKEAALEKIFKLVNPRLLDKSQSVRLAATNACGAISASNLSPDLTTLIPDYLINSLMKSSQHDSSFAIRAAALKSLPINEDTLPVVLGRVRDVKEKVRMEALTVLRTSKEADVVKDLNVEDRIEVLRNGLSKRCKNTYSKTVELLCTNWLKSVKFDPIELVRLLDPSDSENETVCEGVIRAIFSVAWEDDEVTSTTTLKELSNPEIRALRDNVESVLTSIQDEELEPAHAVFLRVKCALLQESKQLTEIQRSQQLQKIFVDVPVLCDVLMTHLQNFKTSIKDRQDRTNDLDEEESESYEENQSFICLQLLKISRFTDLQEEGSRRHFFSILREILTSLETPDLLIDSCLQSMLMAHEHETEFVKDVSTILNDILRMSTSSETMNSVETQIMAASNETKLRMASILSVVLEKVARTNTEDGNLNSFHSLIMPMVTSENVTLKEAGVSCLGKFALLSGEEDVVERFQSILLKIANNPREKDAVRAQAALSLCDLAILFQPEIIIGSPRTQLEEDISSLIATLIAHHEDVMVIITAEICIKLMIANKLHNADILSKLLIMYFDTNYFAASLSNEDIVDLEEVGCPTRLLQMLSVFLPAYAMTNEIAQSALVASLKPLLVSASERIKDRKSKASVLNSKKMIGYVCSLVDMGVKHHQNKTTRDKSSNNDCASNSKILSAMIILCETILEYHLDFTKIYTRGLCKTLGATIGALEEAEVDEHILEKLTDVLVNIDDIFDDDNMMDEYDEISKVIDTMKPISAKEPENTEDTNKDKDIDESEEQDEEVEETLAGRMSEVSMNGGERRRSARLSRLSTESAQSARTTRSGRKSTDSVGSTTTSHSTITHKRSTQSSSDSVSVRRSSRLSAGSTTSLGSIQLSTDGSTLRRSSRLSGASFAVSEINSDPEESSTESETDDSLDEDFDLDLENKVHSTRRSTGKKLQEHNGANRRHLSTLNK